MTYYDGGILGLYPVHTSGPTADRFNLVITSEGYRYDQMWQFVVDADELTGRLLATPPLDRLRCRINVYRLDVWSAEAGCADPNIPGTCNGTGYDPRTFFDSTYCGYGIERLIVVDKVLVEWVRLTYAAWAHELVIVVNADKNGGNGDTYATVAKGSGWDWAKVAIHELGHSAWGLGDEYDFLTACDDENRQYTGPEPDWPNVAKDIGRASIKWAGRIQASTPLPTQSNPDCVTCDSSASGYPPDTIGAFEGAGLYHCGLFRGQEACIMRYADDFCAVCSDAIAADMMLFAPHCSAPVFSGSSGWLCWLKRLFLLLGLVLLSLLLWYPAAACAYRRLLFRVQRCERGNDDPCLDLDATLHVTAGAPAVASYPREVAR